MSQNTNKIEVKMSVYKSPKEQQLLILKRLNKLKRIPKKDLKIDKIIPI